MKVFFLKSILLISFVSFLLVSSCSSMSTFAKMNLTKSDEEIVLCTWNIAHYFAYGSAKNVIDGPIFDSKLKEFREILYDSINADIVSLNEYSTDFGFDKDSISHSSADVLFEKYNTKFDGGATKRGVGHNAVYTNLKTSKFKKRIFKYNRTTKFKNSYDYYYLTTDIAIKGEKVKFVCVYLIYANSDPNLVQGQIDELIDEFKDEPRIIICGDFNTSNYSKFKNAGYTLANNGSLRTYYKTSKPLDNIAAKGVRISKVRIVKTELSDHYPLICHISLE